MGFEAGGRCKYLGKINWIFAHCGRLCLWVAVRCAPRSAALSARTLQWESIYTNNFARLLIGVPHESKKRYKLYSWKQLNQLNKLLKVAIFFAKKLGGLSLFWTV